MARRLSRGVKQRVRQELGRQASPPGPSLKQLGAAFAPTYVLPEDRLQKAIAQNIRATAAAVQRLTAQKGISVQEAGRELRQLRKEVTARGRILKSARRGGLSKFQTSRELWKAGVRPELLKARRHEFVTPGGRFEVTTVPGLVVGRRRLRPQVPPRPRPTPRSTPTPPRRR